MNLLRSLFLFLTEHREYLDRSTYGCWIDTNAGNAIVPVGHGEREKHLGVLFRHYLELWDDVSYEDLREDPYLIAFKHGLVRIVHQHDWNLNISGFLDDIKKAKGLLIPSFSQPDVERIVIDIYSPNGAVKSKDFDTLKVKNISKAIQFIS